MKTYRDDAEEEGGGKNRKLLWLIMPHNSILINN